MYSTLSTMLIATQSAIKELLFPNLSLAAELLVDTMCGCTFDHLHDLHNADRTVSVGERAENHVHMVRHDY